MLYYAVGVHLFWSLALFADPNGALNAVVLVGTKWLVDLGFGAYDLAILLTLASTFALIGLLGEKSMTPRNSFLLALPQFLLMIAASLSDTITIVAGEYNGREINRFLLLAALGPLVWAGILHTIAILDRYHTRELVTRV